MKKVCSKVRRFLSKWNFDFKKMEVYTAVNMKFSFVSCFLIANKMEI